MTKILFSDNLTKTKKLFVVKKLGEYKIQKLTDLKPYERNARKHSAEQIIQIQKSILEFGFTNPILVDEQNEIIAGHGRLEAAKKLEMQEVPSIVIAGLTKAQKRALVIADNQIALNASWDDNLLISELRLLENEGFNLDLTGFNEDEIDALLDRTRAEKEGLIDDDEAPEAPENPLTQLGQQWILGDHILRCGSSTESTEVEKLMGGGCG